MKVVRSIVLMMPICIQSITSEDDRAFMEWLYTKYYRLMYGTVWKYTDDPQEADDIVSDSIVALMDRIDTLRGMEPTALTRYIVVTVRNTALNHLKRLQLLRERFPRAMEAISGQAPVQESFERSIALRDTLAAILRLVDELPEKEQIVLQLKYSSDMSNDEIARIAGLSPESVRKYLSRARARIKDAIFREEGDGL